MKNFSKKAKNLRLEFKRNIKSWIFKYKFKNLSENLGVLMIIKFFEAKFLSKDLKIELNFRHLSEKFKF